MQQAQKTIAMKKAVQPLTAATSKFELFDTDVQLTPANQQLIKGGNEGDDDTGIIAEEVIEH